MEPKVSLPQSQEPATCPYPERTFYLTYVVPKDQSKPGNLWNVS
jgi:hypothetical protein